MGLILAAPHAASAQAGESEAAFSLLFTLIILALGAGALIAAWKKDLIRPGSFARMEPAESPPASAAPILIFLFAGGFLVSAIASLLAVLALGIETGRDSELTIGEQGLFALVTFVSGTLGAALLFVLARRLWRLKRFEPQPRGSILGLVNGLLIGVAIVPLLMSITFISARVMSLLGRELPDAIAHDTLNDIISPEAGLWRWAFIAGAVIGAPVYEEILFRGFLQSAIVSVLRKRWLAILIASGVFVLPHISPGIEPHSLPAIGALGIAAGIAYERTGTIWVPIGVHMAYNGVNVALSFALTAGA